jgi:Flp pilus assembly protein TadG
MNKRRPLFKQSQRSKGQSLIIVAFAIIALIALVGLAVDLGLVYVERIRVRRAADAAALAAAAELPLEGAAQVRALEYLQENDYSCGLTASYAGGNLSFTCSSTDTRVEINPGYAGHYTTGPAEADAEQIIRVQTVPYRDDVYQTDSANMVEVEVVSRVPLYFMKILGFASIPVSGRAVGENINNLDVALIFDRSGSMEFDTLCYGCWTQQDGVDYPSGQRWPLPWNDGDGDGTPDHCEGSQPYTYSGRKYLIIEAEDYSYHSVPYDRDLYQIGMSYWVVQRNGGSRSDNSQLRGDNDYLVGAPGANSGAADAYGRDSVGAYVSHMPFWSHNGSSSAPGNDCQLAAVQSGVCTDDTWAQSLGGPFPVPRLDYEFTVPDGGTWHFWMRGLRGNSSSSYFWSVDSNSIEQDTFGGYGTYYNGADNKDWQWDKMGSRALSAGTHTLHVYAGGAGVDLDRMIITNNSNTPPSSVRGSESHIDNSRTNEACYPCDARYGGYPGASGQGGQPPHCQISGNASDTINLRYLDDIYDDEQPIRGAVEAAKDFVEMLDPAYDQIGLVSYSSRARIDNELECVRRLGSTNCTPQIITDTVMSSLDHTHANGGTNIGEGIKLGIDVLSNTPGQYGRPSAAHIMVLMTDGESNQTGGLDTSKCTASLWPNDGVQSKDCVVYYAQLARNNGIVIYTITLGGSADIELLQYVAELTGGVHRHAPRPEQLGPIFEELYQRIFLRLVE